MCKRHLETGGCGATLVRPRLTTAQLGVHTQMALGSEHITSNGVRCPTGLPLRFTTSAIPDFGTHAVALWEAMQHCTALHSVPQRESEGPPSDSAVKRP